MNALLRAITMMTIVAGWSGASDAQGVLDRIRPGGKLVIPHREASLPFSYVDSATKRPIGYAVDLCLKLADAVGREAGFKNVQIDFLLVTPSDRLATIEQGKADLECGSATNNAERRQRVAFTIAHFITGARLLVKADSTIDRFEDLMGKRLVSTEGTALKAAEQANRERYLGIRILEAPDNAKVVNMVKTGEADAFVMDDVLLFGLVPNRPNLAAPKVVGRFMAIEPLAFMLSRKDPEFKKRGTTRCDA